MTTKEIKAKVETIEKLSTNNEIKALCDAIGALVDELEDKEKIGFKDKK